MGLHHLILHAQSGYISTFIVKWITRKPDLRNCDRCSIAIHDTRSRPKGVQTLKNTVKFQGSIEDGKYLGLE